MKTGLPRKLITVAGAAVTVVALAAYARALIGSLRETDVLLLVSQHWPALVLAACIYLLAFIPMTQSWVVLARASAINASAGLLARIFLVSQIAKYVPGNVGNILGRVYVGARMGVPAARTGLAIGMELAATLIACAIMTGLVLLFMILQGDERSGLISTDLYGRYGNALIFVLAALLLCCVAGFFYVRTKAIVVTAVPSFLLGIVLICATFVLAATCNLVIISTFSDWPDTRRMLLVLTAFLASWLAGFLTPGSPAGIGVREFTFLSILQTEYSTEVLAISAAAFRLVTTGADLLAWGTGLVMRSQRLEPAAIHEPDIRAA